jgi:lysophospholipase L1-like esterase
MRRALAFLVVLALGFVLGIAFHRAGLLQATVAAILPKRPPDLSDGTTYRFVAPLELAFPTKADVVMVGDSMTEAPIWSAAFPDVRVANEGISSDTTDGVLRRMDAILATGAKTAFVMLGINDIRRNVPQADTVANYAKIIDDLRNAGMKVYVESTVYTRNATETAPITALDHALQAMCIQGPCTFVDLNAVLSVDGLERAEFSFDGTHLTPAGYQAWVGVIRPLLEADTDPKP